MTLQGAKISKQGYCLVMEFSIQPDSERGDGIQLYQVKTMFKAIAISPDQIVQG
jgi:hypothetical protein